MPLLYRSGRYYYVIVAKVEAAYNQSHLTQRVTPDHLTMDIYAATEECGTLVSCLNSSSLSADSNLLIDSTVRSTPPPENSSSDASISSVQLSPFRYSSAITRLARVRACFDARSQLAVMGYETCNPITKGFQDISA